MLQVEGIQEMKNYSMYSYTIWFHKPHEINNDPSKSKVTMGVSERCQWVHLSLWIGSFQYFKTQINLHNIGLKAKAGSQDYSFTLWSRVLLKKLTVTQLIKKFPTLYRIWRFITVFTRAYKWSLPWARCIQSTPSHPISLRYILILRAIIAQLV
jgi:hypothetical protein